MSDFVLDNVATLTEIMETTETIPEHRTFRDLQASHALSTRVLLNLVSCC